MRIAGWRYPVVVDLAGMAIPSQNRPIRFGHDAASGVGHTDEIRMEDGQLLAAGVVSRETAAAKEVVASARNGFPWQASIGASVDEFEFVKETSRRRSTAGSSPDRERRPQICPGRDQLCGSRRRRADQRHRGRPASNTSLHKEFQAMETTVTAPETTDQPRAGHAAGPSGFRNPAGPVPRSLWPRPARPRRKSAQRPRRKVTASRPSTSSSAADFRRSRPRPSARVGMRAARRAVPVGQPAGRSAQGPGDACPGQ